MDKKAYIQSVGRRKEAIAKVRLFKGVSQITVNEKPIFEYFKGIVFQKLYQQPFELTNMMGQYTATIKIEGGGQMSQLGATIHGLSRALAATDKTFRSSLKKAGLLTRDARVKERRKYGLAHKARAKKQSPKR